MNTFQVNDVTCGHCVGTIRGALGRLDPEAEVGIDLHTQRVAVESAQATAAQVQAAIERAGDAAVEIEQAAASTPRHRGGCCCA